VSKTRTALTTTTSVDDRLALVGGQEWNVSGVKLLKQLLYQHTSKVEIPTYFGEDAAGQDVTFYGTTASSYVMWDESADKLKSGGKVDIEFVMSGGALDKGNTYNRFAVDASANVVAITGWLEVSTVGPTTAVSSLPAGNTIAFYKTGANSIGVAVDTGGGVIQYGSLTNSGTAY